MAETISYAPLDWARSEVKQASGEDVGGENDRVLLRALRHVSARIDEIKGVSYAPHIQTRYFDASGDHIDPFTNALELDAPLLEVTSLTVGGNAWAADVDFVTTPKGETPIRKLRAISSKAWGTHSGDPFDSIAVTGVWGFRRGYTQAWAASLDSVQDAPLSSGATSITVSDADGTDAYGSIPRFSPGQMLRLEAEFVEVLAVNTQTNVLTVRRGARGSTAASHTQGTAISVWMPESTVTRAALRWAGLLYKRRGEFTTREIDPVGGVTVITLPQDAPTEVINILDELPEFSPLAGV